MCDFVCFCAGDIAAVLTVKYIGEDMAKIVDGGQELIASISEGRYARPLPNMNKYVLMDCC